MRRHYLLHRVLVVALNRVLGPSIEFVQFIRRAGLLFQRLDDSLLQLLVKERDDCAVELDLGA